MALMPQYIAEYRQEVREFRKRVRDDKARITEDRKTQIAVNTTMNDVLSLVEQYDADDDIWDILPGEPDPYIAWAKDFPQYFDQTLNVDLEGQYAPKKLQEDPRRHMYLLSNSPDGVLNSQRRTVSPGEPKHAEELLVDADADSSIGNYDG